jgi:hypothetical protein
MSGAPSTSRLAGQLDYLFEDRPELRGASVAVLTERLNHEDRYARARAQYPLETDAEVAAHIDEFPARIAEADVDAALTHLRGAGT